MDITPLAFKVLAGEASEQERAQLDQWTNTCDSNRAEFEDLKLLWQSKGAGDTSVPVFYDGLYKIKNRIEGKIRQQRKASAATWLVILIIGLLGNGFLFLHYSNSREQREPLVFNDASLQEVIEVLEVEYDITIKVQEEVLLSCAFSGTFHKVDSVQDIIYSLATALSLQYERLGKNSYVLTGAGC